MGLYYLKISNDPPGCGVETYFAVAINEAGRYFTFNYIWDRKGKFIYVQFLGKRWSKKWHT